MVNKRKAISEIVASMLLLLIIVSIGTALYLYLYYRTTFHRQRTEQQILEEEIKAKEQVAILLAVGSSKTNRVKVVLAIGPNPVRIYAVYVNDTLAVNYSPPQNHKPLEIVELEISSPITLQPNSIVLVRVVYGGGYVEALGEVA
ncbi:MAG: hypothetical protein B6U76_11995 [Desulfurococcales archaeon ex4484_217_2]|nr:MAG: hypothetical protein B6U76_11995 [Desulfurococcales archaeon ex4484_217_2]